MRRQKLRTNTRQTGFVLSVETIIFATIIVLGCIVGWVNIRDSFNAELFDTANAIESSITFPYFSDPNRGNPVPFDDNTFEFQDPSPSEGDASPGTGANL